MTDLQTVSRTSALMTASLAAMAWSASANAQTATSSPAAPHFAATAAENQPAVQGRADASGAVQAPSGGAGDIVVTARKRQELARDVPISILAVSGDKLAERNVLRLTDLVTVAPNFTLSLGGGQPATYLRGFGTYGTTFAQSVGKFVDNVSYGRDIHSRLPLFDIQRVEVLNGPQVLLYGNSTTAGAINITTKTPGDKFSVDALVSHEFNFHETTIDASVTVPVTETLSIRGALFYQDLNKGWLHNTSTNQDDPRFRNRGYRGTALFKPTPNLEIKVKGEFTSVRDRGSNGQQIRQSTNPNRQLTDVTFDDNRQAAIAGGAVLRARILRSQQYGRPGRHRLEDRAGHPAFDHRIPRHPPEQRTEQLLRSTGHRHPAKNGLQAVQSGTAADRRSRQGRLSYRGLLRTQRLQRFRRYRPQPARREHPPAGCRPLP